MSSDDSDDEPLSKLAAQKKEYELEILPIYVQKGGHFDKLGVKRPCDVTISIQSHSQAEPQVIERPDDVWLYLRDFNPQGPYTCLICNEWFLNKNRIVVHYVIDHMKMYCGICRYLVASKEAWIEHQKFHTPWKCSICGEGFDTNAEWNEHISQVHNVVHCRFCCLRIPEGDDFTHHLTQKHLIAKMDHINDDCLWEFDPHGIRKFQCLLCLKSGNVGKEFVDHFMSHHRFAMKCFTYIVSWVDLPFKLKGIDLTPEFVESELKSYTTFGYIDFVKSLKVKEEVTTTSEEPVTVNCEPDFTESFNENEDEKLTQQIHSYKGVEDFDAMLVEVVVIQKCYSDYVHAVLKELSLNTVPVTSKIAYSTAVVEPKPISCIFCAETFPKKISFENHVAKVHNFKDVPLYWCRICAAAFDSFIEFQNHCRQELGEFDGLWLCQFCDKEFGGREEARQHLTEHWEQIEYDNCFSPHLGFKCRFCPILFWNETDREVHHVKAHFHKQLSEFYSCSLCGKIFGDKIFYIHHYVENHDTDTVYVLKCCICSTVFGNVDEIRTHFAAEHPKARKPYCCLDDCRYRPFKERKSLLMHLKTLHTPAARATRPTICQICGQGFNTPKACSLHIAQAHARLHCKHCDISLQTTDEKRIHYLISHPDNAQFQCKLCDKSFQHKSSLYMHRQQHKPTTEDYTCEYCNKSFKKRDSYREHMLIHEAPRHACSFCPMRFVQRSNMLRHERRHTGERPYSCTYCGRTFTDKGACNSHMRTHQKHTPFACVYCGQTFAQKSKLTYHIRRHTGENLETCPVCSKIFTSAGSLRDHMRVHEKQRVKKTVKCPLCKKMYMDTKDMLKHLRGSHTAGHYQCPLCDKTLSSGGALREHVLTHSKKRVFQCKFCPKSYNRKNSVVGHLGKRHGIKPPIPTDFYRFLSPKDCDLGLSDDVIDKIFNTKTKTNTEVIIGDFVTFNTGLEITASQENTAQEQNEQGSEQEGSQSEENSLHGTVQVKVEPDDDDENNGDGDENGDEDQNADNNHEVLPTNFVNVKIECMDDEYSNSE